MPPPAVGVGSLIVPALILAEASDPIGFAQPTRSPSSLEHMRLLIFPLFSV